MKTNIISTICITFSLFCPTGTAYAQNSSLLEQYRSAALQYNQDVRSADKNILLNKELEKSAKADYKPKLSAGANFTYTGNPTQLTLDPPAWDTPLTLEGRESKYSASLSLSQPIYTGGRISHTVKKARNESNLAVNQSLVVKSDICYQADLRYWSTVAHAEVANITGQFRRSVEQLTNVVKERVEVELVNRNDLLMAEVKLNEATYQLMQAQNNYEVSRMAMNSFAGIGFGDNMPVDSLVPAIRSTGALAGYMDDAANNRAELKAAQDKIAIQESARKITDSKYLPQLYIGVDGSYGSPGYDFRADLDPNYVVYAKLSVPLFEWGKRKNEKKASTYKIDMARNNYSKVNDAVNLEVRSAYYSFNQAIEQVTLTESSLAKAKENEAVAMDRYKEGEISITEVLDAQIYHQTAQLNNVRSRLNAQLSHSEFIQALGIYHF